MATSGNAELLALSGPRSPYPGRLGVVETGALADLLLVDGNPFTNLELVADPAKRLLMMMMMMMMMMMEDGKIYKNSLKQSRLSSGLALGSAKPHFESG